MSALLVWLSLSPLDAPARVGCEAVPSFDRGTFAGGKQGCCGSAQNGSLKLPKSAWDEWRVAASAASILLRLGDARVALIGDSLTEQTFDALRVQAAVEGSQLAHRAYACALLPLSSAMRPLGDCPSCVCPVGTQPVESCGGKYVSAAELARIRLKWPQYNVRLSRFPTMVLPASLVAPWVRWADMAVVNAGAHYDFLPPFLYNATVSWFRDMLVRDAADAADAVPADAVPADAVAQPGSGKKRRKRHAWRMTYPTHWVPPPLGKRYHHLGDVCNDAAQRLVASPHWSNAEAERVLLGSGIALITAPEAMAHAGTLHSIQRTAAGGPADCLHWCYAWPLFAPVWNSVAERWANRSMVHIDEMAARVGVMEKE